MKKLSVLDVGSGPESAARQVLASDGVELNIIRLDVDPDAYPDYVHDITNPLPDELHGKFDVVYVSHVMEHIDRNNVIKALKNLVPAVRNYGEMWIIVPSFEFACREVLEGRDSPGIQGMIFGGQNTQWDYHRCGFTLKELRFMAEVSGLVTRRSYQSPFMLVINDQPYNGLQNIVIGMRYVGDASEAIE